MTELIDSCFPLKEVTYHTKDKPCSGTLWSCFFIVSQITGLYLNLNSRSQPCDLLKNAGRTADFQVASGIIER